MPNATAVIDPAVAKDAQKAVNNAKTIQELRDVWRNFYLTVGHRALGRMLLGTYDAWAAKKAAK